MERAPFVVRHLTPGDAALVKTIRLEALRTNPEAFGSNVAREEAFPMSVWEERAPKFAMAFERINRDLPLPAGAEDPILEEQTATSLVNRGVYEPVGLVAYVAFPAEPTVSHLVSFGLSTKLWDPAAQVREKRTAPVKG
ncbi:hypothetical protein FRB99_005596 [Tulasnella sp. 403]|nr:hypothetical protein FRB99_005596 [Tulasnella sp. 403]